MEITAKIEIDETELSSSLEEGVSDYLDNHLDDRLDSAIDRIIEHRDFKDALEHDVKEMIESYMTYDFDLDSEISNVDLSSHFNVSREIESLLDTYDPENPCVTGKAFKEAVLATIANENVNKVLQPFTKEEVRQLIKESVDQLVRIELTNAVKIALKQEFTNGFFDNIKKDFMSSIYSFAMAEVNSMNRVV